MGKGKEKKSQEGAVCTEETWTCLTGAEEASEEVSFVAPVHPATQPYKSTNHYPQPTSFGSGS